MSPGVPSAARGDPHDGRAVPARRSPVRTFVRAIRLHQWVKNILIFVPLLAAHEFSDPAAVLTSVAAFVVYGICASGVYVLNDLLDIEADRAHPRKRYRPIAAGELGVRAGYFLAFALLGLALVLALRITTAFALLLGAYFAVTNLYGLWLKRVPILDTLVLAGLYTLRILAGAAAIAVVPSFWLLAFSMFFFFSLALAKRYSELVGFVDTMPVGTPPGGSLALSVIPGRSYRVEDLSTLMTQGTSSGLAAVLVLALYINSDTVRAQFGNPQALWFICPLLTYWITKLWLNTQRRELTDDPVIWAVTNRVSIAIMVLCLALFAIAI